jgi:hypothetical protein
LPYADAGIVVGDPAPDLLEIPLLRNIWKRSHWRTPATEAEQPGEVPSLGLREAGYFTERIGGQFSNSKLDLSSYRMLVLPETALLDDELAERIREYVRRGGRILAFGHASLFDPTGRLRKDFSLGDVFGVSFTEPLPGYKQLEHLPESNLTSSTPLNPGAVGVRTTTGKCLAIWNGAGGAPAIVENRFGKGRCLYTSAEESQFGEGSPLLAELTGRLIGAPSITVKAERKYSLLMNRQAENFLLYLMDRSTRSRTSADFWSAREPQVSLPAVDTKEWVSIILNTDVLGEIHEAELIGSSRRNPAVSRRIGVVELVFQASPSVTSVWLKR